MIRHKVLRVCNPLVLDVVLRSSDPQKELQPLLLLGLKHQLSYHFKKDTNAIEAVDRDGLERKNTGTNA